MRQFTCARRGSGSIDFSSPRLPCLCSPRTYAESIAFLSGAAAEERRAGAALGAVVANKRSIVNRTFWLSGATTFFANFGGYLSYGVVAVPVFAGAERVWLWLARARVMCFCACVCVCVGAMYVCAFFVCAPPRHPLRGRSPPTHRNVYLL